MANIEAALTRKELLMKIVILAALSIAAISQPAAAKVVGMHRDTDGTEFTITDTREAPDAGYTLRGCGTRATTDGRVGQPACIWVKASAASSQPAAPQRIAAAQPAGQSSLPGVMTPEQFAAQAAPQVPAAAPQQVAVAQSAPQARPQDVSQMGNPLVGGAKPTTQVAYQKAPDGSERIVTYQKGLSFGEVLGAVLLGGVAVATNGGGYYGYDSRYIPASCIGRPRGRC